MSDAAPPPLAWCETAAATGREHLRRLSPAGLKSSGGSDTLTLCGLKPSWDLESPVTPESLARLRTPDRYSYPCTGCVEILNGARPLDPNP
jgi:hypothetical protein